MQSKWRAGIGMAIGLFLAWVQPLDARAGQASADLQILVTGAPAAPVRAFCSSTLRPGSFGATVTVVCSTGVVAGIAGPGRFTATHGGAYRYLLQFSYDGQSTTELIASAGADAGAAWRRVRLGDQDYLELTLTW